MGVPIEKRPKLQSLNSQLREQMSFYRLSTNGRAPLWFGRALSNIMLLVDDEEVVYLTGNLNSSDASARIVVFTPDLVVIAGANSINEDDAELTTTAISRRTIASLAVSAGETVFSDDAFSQWPGTDTTLTVTYTGIDGPITLPLERTMSGDHVTPIVELLASLKADLVSR